MDATALHAARAEAADRMTFLGLVWCNRFKVSVADSGGLHGRASVKVRSITAPWPTTTRKRLYILAHEIGHVALNHCRGLPRYVEEFEAEQFAIGLMRQSAIPVPHDMLMRAKRYVHRKIKQAHIRGLQSLDPDIDRWSGGDGAKGFGTKSKFYAVALKRVAAALEPKS